MTLQEFFMQNPETAVAFSGGVDSAYLVWAAAQWGRRVKAYYVKSAFQPEFELEDAVRLAGELGVEMEVLPVDILAEPEVVANPWNRCYFCKKRIMGTIREAAIRDGFDLLLDGTNASDDVTDRPGMQALSELRVMSPLRLCGLTKAQVREKSKEAGLFTWDKPAYACLATRMETGRRLTAEDLRRTEEGEDLLRRLGFRDFRIRTVGDMGKLQIRQADMDLLMKNREKILLELRKLYGSVVLDLEVRG